MQVVHTIAELRAFINQQKSGGKTIGFVPTMGNLHAGHISLISAAHEHADCVVASIFVNPTQFGENEDLSTYPRTLQADIDKLEAANCHALFAPTEDEIYPRGKHGICTVSLPALTEPLCGKDRPGHFDGVTTVVSKLFNIVQPDVACFGQKDYQQLAVIRQMVEDLNFAVKLVGVPTARADDGLALSSRNGFLTAEERAIAPLLQQTLQHMKQQILAGNTNYVELEYAAKQALERQGFKVDYLEVRHATTLAYPDQSDKALVIAAAAKLGTPRLIDNITVNR